MNYKFNCVRLVLSRPTYRKLHLTWTTISLFPPWLAWVSGLFCCSQTLKVQSKQTHLMKLIIHHTLWGSLEACNCEVCLYPAQTVVHFYRYKSWMTPGVGTSRTIVVRGVLKLCRGEDVCLRPRLWNSWNTFSPHPVLRPKTFQLVISVPSQAIIPTAASWKIH